MMNVADASLPSVSFAGLRRKVTDTKAPSTARYYLAMLSRLEEFVQADSISLANLTPEFVSNFGDFLIRNRVTPSSVKLFQMSLRAVMKDEFGKENVKQFREAFSAVGSQNLSKGFSITFDELKAVTRLNLDDKAILWKSRAIYLYCVYSAGLSFASLKTECIKGELRPGLPQQQRIISEFQKRYEIPFADFVASFPEADYAKTLIIIGALAEVVMPLTPESSADAWIVTAQKCSLAADLIVATLKTETDFTRSLTSKKPVSQLEIEDALTTVANRISDEHLHWYVMRCYTQDAAETSETITEDAKFLEGEMFKTFYPYNSKSRKKVTKYTDVDGKQKKVKATTRQNFFNSMLFFNTTLDNAAKLRKYMGTDAYVYTRVGSSTPAHISDSEMKRFMLLCDISSGEIDYYFPDSSESNPDLIGTDSLSGRTAQIVLGDFTGTVGIVQPLKDDKYRVRMTFTSLGGFKVTAIVPLSSLRFPN